MLGRVGGGRLVEERIKKPEKAGWRGEKLLEAMEVVVEMMKGWLGEECLGVVVKRHGP